MVMISWLYHHNHHHCNHQPSLSFIWIESRKVIFCFFHLDFLEIKVKNYQYIGSHWWMLWPVWHFKIIQGVFFSSILEICFLPKDPGPCKSNVRSWYFDVDTLKCLPLVYGGCLGNRNRFPTLADCAQLCITTSPAEQSLSVTSPANSVLKSFAETARPLKSSSARLSNGAEASRLIINRNARGTFISVHWIWLLPNIRYDYKKIAIMHSNDYCMIWHILHIQCWSFRVVEPLS